MLAADVYSDGKQQDDFTGDVVTQEFVLKPSTVGTKDSYCFFTVSAESFRWNQRNYQVLELEVDTMPKDSKLFIQYSYDPNQRSEKHNYAVIDQTTTIRKVSAENFETISVLMDKPGTYKFRAYQRVDSTKKKALQPKETFAFSIVITVCIGFSLLFIFFLVFLLPRFCVKCIQWKKDRDKMKLQKALEAE